MTRRERRRRGGVGRAAQGVASEDDDERLARAALAQLRQGWAGQRRRARALWSSDSHMLEACALRENDDIAFRPPGPTLMDILAAETLRTFSEPPEALPPEDALRLPGDTRKALALWARYSLARLELLGGGRTGDA